MQMVRLVYGHIMFMHKRPFFFKLLAISSNGCFFFFTFYHSRGKIWSVYGKMTCSKGNPPTKTKTKKRENVDQILFHVSLLNGKQMPLHSLRNLNKSSTFFSSVTFTMYAQLWKAFQSVYLPVTFYVFFFHLNFMRNPRVSGFNLEL